MPYSSFGLCRVVQKAPFFHTTFPVLKVGFLNSHLYTMQEGGEFERIEPW